MDGGNGRRFAIKLCFKADISATEKLELMQKAYANEAVQCHIPTATGRDNCLPLHTRH